MHHYNFNVRLWVTVCFNKFSLVTKPSTKGKLNQFKTEMQFIALKAPRQQVNLKLLLRAVATIATTSCVKF